MISGGTSAIGLALAWQLASAGWDLTILARNLDRLAAAKAALTVDGAGTLTYLVDVADGDGVERAVRTAIEV